MRNPVGLFHFRGFYVSVSKTNINDSTTSTIIYFDQELSNMIFSMISKIEVALRVRFDVFIKHNFDKHEGEVPVWAVVEVLSFGTLSKIIKNLKTGAGSAYAVLADNYKYTSKKGNSIKASQKMFTSWVQAVSVLRNMCAHNSRIYNRTIHTTPEIPDIDKITPPPVDNGLYQILLAMKYLRSSDDEWNIFINNLETLFQNNISVISLTAMNFPVDWKAHLSV